MVGYRRTEYMVVDIFTKDLQRQEHVFNIHESGFHNDLSKVRGIGEKGNLHEFQVVRDVNPLHFWIVCPQMTYICHRLLFLKVLLYNVCGLVRQLIQVL